MLIFFGLESRGSGGSDYTETNDVYFFLNLLQVALLGIDIISTFVDRISDHFRGYVGTGKCVNVSYL